MKLSDIAPVTPEKGSPDFRLAQDALLTRACHARYVQNREQFGAKSRNVLDALATLDAACQRLFSQKPMTPRGVRSFLEVAAELEDHLTAGKLALIIRIACESPALA